MTDRVMLDLETLGTEPECAIVQIGAVRFGTDGLGETFEAQVDAESCERVGLDTDAATMQWWVTQDNAEAVLTGGDDITAVLKQLDHYLHGVDELWANSPAFDCAILDAAFEAIGMDAPWEYYQERDYRTLSHLAIAPDDDHDAAHDALADATHQAEQAAEILRRLGGGDG